MKSLILYPFYKLTGLPASFMSAGKRPDTPGSETQDRLPQQQSWPEYQHFLQIPQHEAERPRQRVALQERDPGLRVSDSFIMGFYKACLPLSPEEDVIFILLGSKQTCPVLQRETQSVSSHLQGCSRYKHPRRDRTKGKREEKRQVFAGQKPRWFIVVVWVCVGSSPSSCTVPPAVLHGCPETVFRATFCPLIQGNVFL